MLAVEFPTAVIAALAGLISALGGLIGTIMAARKARTEAEAACEEQLRVVRLEANELARKLYEGRPEQ